MGSEPPPQKPSMLNLPHNPWRSTSPALGPRKGVFAGRRVLEAETPPPSPSPPASLASSPIIKPIPLSPRIEEGSAPSPLSPRYTSLLINTK